MGSLTTTINNRTQRSLRGSSLTVGAAAPVTATPLAVLAGSAVSAAFGLGIWAGYAVS
ncbi:hypothetical protein ACI2IX_19860 [Leifsonia aquatica]|uniref:hypothetical protein n=1 Tax=Leifsonia aquatica TaxID=144185 RepID=UPI00384BFFCE